MVVKVKLFATFRYGRFVSKEVEVPPGCNVDWILSELNISPEEAAIILVNGRSLTRETLLNDGDTVALFPPVGGG